MQHKTDIEKAIRTLRVPEIEDAFRALVNWPGEDEIAGLTDARDALALLIRTAKQLGRIGDERIVPGHILDLVRGLRHGEDLVEGTYASAAAAVLVNLDRFLPAFKRTFAEARGAMPTRNDLEAATRATSLPAVEGAFQAMLRFWSGAEHIDGLLGPRNAMDLLAAAAQRLVDLDDRNAMPAAVRDMIDDLTRGDHLDGDTFADGAALMLAEARLRQMHPKILGAEG